MAPQWTIRGPADITTRNSFPGQWNGKIKTHTPTPTRPRGAAVNQQVIAQVKEQSVRASQCGHPSLPSVQTFSLETSSHTLLPVNRPLPTAAAVHTHAHTNSKSACRCVHWEHWGVHDTGKYWGFSASRVQGRRFQCSLFEKGKSVPPPPFFG